VIKTKAKKPESDSDYEETLEKQKKEKKEKKRMEKETSATKNTAKKTKKRKKNEVVTQEQTQCNVTAQETQEVKNPPPIEANILELELNLPHDCPSKYLIRAGREIFLQYTTSSSGLGFPCNCSYCTTDDSSHARASQ